MTESTNPSYLEAIAFINKMERVRISGDYDDRYYFGLAKGYITALDSNKLITEEEYKSLVQMASYLDPK